MRGIASDHVDPIAIGRQQLRLWPTLLEQGMQARARRPDRESRFLDLRFQKILADPLACVRRIYRHFDLELSVEAEARMQQYLARHPRQEHGAHRYSLSSFGLDAALVTQTFKAYCERFGVEPEPVA